MWMIYLFPKYIKFSMDILFRMNAHFYFPRHDIFYKLAHPFLYILIIPSFLNVLFQFMKEFFLCLPFIWIKKESLLVSLSRKLININAYKKPYLRCLLYKLPNLKVTRSTEIANKYIKEMYFLIFEHTFYFL